jgi:hypothetical protein
MTKQAGAALLLTNVVQLLANNMTPEQLHAAATTLRAREVSDASEREFNESIARSLEGYAGYAEGKPPA